jgi:hypothetical protein
VTITISGAGSPGRELYRRRVAESVRTAPEVPLWRVVLGRVWKLLPPRARRFLVERFRDVTRSEAAGYVVWSAMGIVVGVPEIWAAVSGSDFVWPTISTTVGHLQSRWPVLALIPVALIVTAAYSVLRITPAATAIQADLQGVGRTSRGRLVKQDVSFDDLASGAAPPATASRGEWRAFPYFAFATVVVVVGAALAAQSENRFLVGYVLYSLIAIFWIVLPNAIAYVFGKDVEFTTLFFTVRALGRRLQFVAALVAALLVILLLHLAFYPWPSLR